jgi:hypothetical protein
MAVTRQQLIEFLERDRRRYLSDTDGEQIICKESMANGRYTVELRLSEGGSCLHFRVPQVVNVGRSPHLAELLAAILELHYRLKLGRFGLDPVDGEIDCEIILPLEDATLTFRQFRRCFGTLLLLVDQQAPRFRSILAGGEDPGSDGEQHHEEFLDQLAELLGMSRQALDEYLAAEGETATDGPDGQR